MTSQAQAGCPRDRHLFDPGPKRILTLDGGGVRGALSIAFLEALEERIAEKAGTKVRLCDWFDLIGGTSTGAILASGLALGLSAAELKDFYFKLGPTVFNASKWRLPGWSAKFDAKRLSHELAAVFGDVRLGSSDLQTGLGLVLKRIDTGGSWIVINNPRSKFWETPQDRAFVGNAALRLADLVRASTAAPSFFAPQVIEVAEGAPPGLFLDGAMTPHNNPALAFFLASVLPPVGLNWQTGPEHLTIVSVGTGSYRPTLSIQEAARSHAIGLAVKALAAQIAENQRLTLMLMSWFGETNMSWPIDSEIGDVGAIKPPFAPLFRFNRFDVILEPTWLADVLGVAFSPQDLKRLRTIDTPSNIPLLYELGQKAAALQVSARTVN